MEQAAAQGNPHNTLIRWGVGLALFALLLPLSAVIAWGIGIALLIRGEVGPGLGVVLLGVLCAILGFMLSALI